MREVREETGVEGRLVEKLGDIRYVYTANWDERKGERIFKVVSFFLLRAGRGRIGEIDEAMRIEVAEARWLPLDEAPRLLVLQRRAQDGREGAGEARARDRRRRPASRRDGSRGRAARCASAARPCSGPPPAGARRRPSAREAAGLEDAGDVEEVCRRCEILLSICPPHAAARRRAGGERLHGHLRRRERDRARYRSSDREAPAASCRRRHRRAAAEPAGHDEALPLRRRGRGDRRTLRRDEPRRESPSPTSSARRRR